MTTHQTAELGRRSTSDLVRQGGFNVLRTIGTLSVIAAVLIGWEIRARVAPSVFVPPVSEIVSRMQEIWFSGPVSRVFLSDTFMEHALVSLGRAGRGWFLSATIGIVGGLILGHWAPARSFFAPLIRFGMSTPSSAMLPVIMIIFGITDSMNVALITLGCTWTVLLNTIDGVRSIDGTMISTARSLHLPWRAMFAKVILPGASPQIFAGLRVSLGLALILMVVGELYAATRGIGYFIVVNQRSFRFLDMWTAVFLLGLFGLLANFLFAGVEKRLLRWHRREMH